MNRTGRGTLDRNKTGRVVPPQTQAKTGSAPAATPIVPDSAGVDAGQRADSARHGQKGRRGTVPANCRRAAPSADHPDHNCRCHRNSADRVS